MKINNNPIMTIPMKMHNQSSVSNIKDLENQSSSGPKVNGNLKDIVELSMSGRNRGQKLTILTGKKNTAGLVIKSLKIARDYGLEGLEAVDKDMAKEFVDKIRPAMLKESLNTILAQGNTNSNSVLHLLR